MLIRLIDLLNRPYASHSTPMEDRWGWVLQRTAERFDCDVDDISTVDSEDDYDLICVRGEPVARVSMDYGLVAS